VCQEDFDDAIEMPLLTDDVRLFRQAFKALQELKDCNGQLIKVSLLQHLKKIVRQYLWRIDGQTLNDRLQKLCDDAKVEKLNQGFFNKLALWIKQIYVIEFDKLYPNTPHDDIDRFRRDTAGQEVAKDVSEFAKKTFPSTKDPEEVWFKWMDDDNDGFVTLHEIAIAVNCTFNDNCVKGSRGQKTAYKHANELLKKHDSNNDGVISRSEFSAMFKGFRNLLRKEKKKTKEPPKNPVES